MQSKVQTFRLAGPFWLFFCLFASPLFSQTSWVGPVGGDWATSANWNNGLPAAGNDALIGGGNSVAISAPLTTSFGVQNFGTITINAALTIGSGSFENSGTMSFASTGSLVNSATFKNFGTSTFTGAATFLNNTGANFQNFGPFTLPTTLTNMGAITNDGTIDATNGTILSSGSFQNNQTFTTKTLTVQAGSSFTNNFGSTLNITGAGSSLDASGFMTNNGTLNNVGDFQVKSNVVNNGTINNNIGGTLTVISGAQLNNSGTILNKATLTNNGTLTNGNNFYNEGTVTNNSQFNNNNRIENRTGASFTNNTSANLDNGFGSVLLNIGTFSNKNSMNFFGLLQNDGGFTNDGTINMNTGSTFDNNLNFTNNNILNTQNTAGNDGTLTNNSVINILSGSIFTNRAAFTNGLAGKINNQFEFVNSPVGTFTNNGVFTNSIRLFLEGQTTNNGYLVNPGDIFVKVGGTLTNASVIDQQAGNTSNEGSIVNQNLFLNDDCSTIANRSGATINNTGGTIRNRGLVFQRGTLSGNTVTNFGGNIHTGATSASTVLCKNPSITADDAGIVKVYATGLIAFANTDSCQNIIYRANGEARPTFGCADIGTIKSVNVVMTTRLGDSLTCVSQVTPTDILAPNFTGCPTDLIVYTSANSATATWTAPTAVDNCSIPTLTVDKAPGSSFNVGITSVNYIATDSKGNSQTCQFKVTVVKVPAGSGCAGDVAGPVFNGCPANISVSTTTQFANATWINPTPVDGCQPITLTATHFSGQAFPVGTTVVRFTAKDGNNNTSTCQFTVNVTQTNLCLTDTQKPNFNDCPANITLAPNPATGSAVAIWSGPSVSDNCAIASVTSNFSSGSLFPTGTTNIIYTAADGAGNTATCNFMVNVGADPCPGDVAGPTFTGCPANISLITAGTSAVANWTAPTVSDACTPVVLNANYAPGAAFPLGVTQVIYTASDKKGNKSTCSFTVTVNTACSVDATLPVITGCPGNVNVSTTGTSQVATWTAPTATDNCTLVSFVTSYLPGSSFPVGTTNVVYTATDLKGNISTCSFNVIVSTTPTGCASNSAPANNATQVNPVGLSLNWAAAAGATSYDVYLGTVNPPTTLVASNVATTSYAPAGLAYNASYFWYVVPKNAVGPLTTCASTATRFNTITTPGCATLSAPANNATNLLPTSVALSWAAVSGATSYDVYLGTVNPPTTTVATNVAGTSFTATNLTGNTAYYWYARPKNAAGSPTTCGAASFKFTTGILPSCATNTAPANNSTAIPQSTTLTWSAAANATSYDLYLGTVNPPTTLAAAGLTTTTYSATNLNLNTTYFWYVLPKNSLGSGSCATTATQFTTGVLPNCPTLTAPANNATGIASSTTLTWAAVSNATKYDVYLGTNNLPTTKIATDITTTTFSATGLVNNTIYYWYVVPKNTFGAATTCGTAFKFTTGTPAPNFCKGPNGTGLYREIWYNIPGLLISDLTSNVNYPNNPSTASVINYTVTPANVAENYGDRSRGYLTVGTTGTYIFTLTGDDYTEFYLSTSSNPASKVRIAYIDGWTNPSEFAKYASQKSVGITLTANVDYYVELLHKEAGGGDHWGLYWQTPGSTTRVQIPPACFSPITTNCTPSISCSGNLFTNGGFENDFNGIAWNDDGVITSTTDVNSGYKSAQVCNAEGGFGFEVPAIPGGTYSFKAFAKISGSPSCAGVGLQFLDANHAIISGQDFWSNITTTTYSQFTFSKVAPANAVYVSGYAWKCGTTGCLFADDFCLTVVAPACNKTALFVVGNTTLGAGDLVIKNRLQALGLTVTVKSDAGATTADATGKGLVVISSTITSTNVNTKFRNVAVPVICYESRLYDDMKMTSSVDGTDFATYGLDYGTPKVYQVNMLAPQHPIGGNLSGWRSVYFSNSYMQWGKPGPGATKIAEIPNQPGKNPIFCYETGASMVGLTAPARRVGLFLYDLTPSILTVDGFKLFDNSVKWAMNCSSLNQLYVAPQTELVFNAYKKAGEVELKWISRTGETNDHFIIERSLDGENWAPISQKIDGRGDENENLYFQEFDESPSEGSNFYRLRLTMVDGSELVSNTQMIDFQQLTPFEIFPNPASDKIFVNLKSIAGEPATLRLFNQQGVQSAEWKIDEATANPFELSVDGRTNGQYTLWIFTEKHRPEARKVMIVNE